MSVSTLEPSITRIPATRLDQLIQILEISFIFLLSYSLITLLDAAVEGLQLYAPIAELFLGEAGQGSLSGGNFEEIVRVTLVFNLLLFAFSLFFGLWIRRTRDNWSWKQLGYTFRTPKYTFQDLVSRGVVLGLVSIVVFFAVLAPITFITSGGDPAAFYLFFAYHEEGVLFSPQALLAEYYFGFVEMGFIWPLSAGFFFFAYCHNSLKARFPFGIANLLATLFYVFYLAFFFVIPTRGKLTQIPGALVDPVFWGMLAALFVVLYISFSAFAETGSVVLPFLLNFVFNVGLTVIRAGNSLFFTEPNPLMVSSTVLVAGVVVVWWLLRRQDFSTIRLGLKHLQELTHSATWESVGVVNLILEIGVFLGLSFLLPGVLEFVVASPQMFSRPVVTLVYAGLYGVMVALAVVVLTYEPTRVYDVLLVKTPAGLPIASHIELFQSDEILISGFFTAIATVNQELDATEQANLRAIRRGDREILLEDGVFTRIIALADRDQAQIRQSIMDLHRTFETHNSLELSQDRLQGGGIPAGTDLVNAIGQLSIRFDFPQQTKWLVVLTLILAPLIIALIGLL